LRPPFPYAMSTVNIQPPLSLFSRRSKPHSTFPVVLVLHEPLTWTAYGPPPPTLIVSA